MKNKNKIILSSLAIILIVGAVIYFQYPQSIIVINNQQVPIATGSVDFDGVTGNYETLYLGSIETDNNIVSINNNNNIGETSISNAIFGGNDLVLSSYSKNVRDNYIEATFDFPKGELFITCQTNAEGGCGEAESFCETEGFKVMTESCDGATTPNVRYDPKDEGTTIVLDEPKTMTFRLETKAYSKGSANAFMDINFVADNPNIGIGGEIEDGKLGAYFYAIPISAIGVLGLIIWRKRKKPKR